MNDAIEPTAMTTPAERMRALKWGFELLDVARADQRLSAATRARAQAVYEPYPFEHLVIALSSQDPPSLPRDFEQGIDDARAFIRDLRADLTTPDDLKQHAMYVQRHYPLPGSTRWAHLPGGHQLLREWVEFPGN